MRLLQSNSFSKSFSRGFTLIEAVVSISLFSLMILGATLQLRAFEDGQRSVSDALVLVKTAREFLTELSQLSRRNDVFDPTSVQRPSGSVLDGLWQGSGNAHTTENSASGVLGDGYNFLDADSETLEAAYAATLQNEFINRWVTPDSDGRSLLERKIGRRADQWTVIVVQPPSTPSPAAYRIIELHLDDNGTTNLRWPICCQ